MKVTKAYQICIWCSDDSCVEFWFEKQLSPIYHSKEMAEIELAKYDNKTSRELEKMCDVISVGNNRPYISIMEIAQSNIVNLDDVCDKLLDMLSVQDVNDQKMIGTWAYENVEDFINDFRKTMEG